MLKNLGWRNNSLLADLPILSVKSWHSAPHCTITLLHRRRALGRRLTQCTVLVIAALGVYRRRGPWSDSEQPSPARVVQGLAACPCASDLRGRRLSPIQ